MNDAIRSARPLAQFWIIAVIGTIMTIETLIGAQQQQQQQQQQQYGWGPYQYNPYGGASFGYPVQQTYDNTNTYPNNFNNNFNNNNPYYPIGTVSYPPQSATQLNYYNPYNSYPGYPPRFQDPYYYPNSMDSFYPYQINSNSGPNTGYPNTVAPTPTTTTVVYNYPNGISSTSYPLVTDTQYPNISFAEEEQQEESDEISENYPDESEEQNNNPYRDASITTDGQEEEDENPDDPSAPSDKDPEFFDVELVPDNSTTGPAGFMNFKHVKPNGEIDHDSEFFYNPESNEAYFDPYRRRRRRKHHQMNHQSDVPNFPYKQFNCFNMNRDLLNDNQPWNDMTNPRNFGGIQNIYRMRCWQQ